MRRCRLQEMASTIEWNGGADWVKSTTTLVGRPKKPGKTMSAESRNGNKTA